MQTANNGNGLSNGNSHRINGDDGVLIVPGQDRAVMHPSSEHSTASHAASILTLKAVVSAFRRRWFMALSLGLIAGIAGAAAVWFTVPAKYTAFAEMQIKEVAEKILFETADKQSAFRTFRQTQMRKVTSPFVLASALRKPEMAHLSMLEQTGDPVHFLETKIEVTSPASEFMRISLAGDEPKELAVVINAVTDAYLEEEVNSEKLKRQKRKDNLEQVHRDFDETLRTRRAAVKKLAEALQTSDSAALTIKQQMAAEYFAKLRREHADTRYERMRAEAQLAVGSADPTTATGQTAIPDALIDIKLDQEPEVLKLNERLLTLDELIRRTRQTVTSEDHPLLVQYNNEIANVKQQIKDVRVKLRPRIISQIQASANAVAQSDVFQLKKRVEVLKAQEAQLNSELETQQLQATKLGVSSFELESLKKEIEQIETMDKKVTEESQRLAIELQSPPRVVLHRAADIPKTPAIEQKYKLTGFAGFGLFFLVCGGIVWVDMTARRINTAEDVVGSLHVPILGYLPELPRSFKHNANSTNGRYLSVKHHWMESVDSTRAILLHDTDQRSINVVMVTSAISGEGKSTLSSQLACSLARSGRTTLLVDSDLRSPSLHTMFDVPNTPGLSELLRGEAEDHDVIQRTQYDGLFVVTAGQVSEEALRCMACERTKPIFARFKSEFNFVVVDSPPVLLVVDALLIGKHVDAAIVAVRRDLSRSTRTAAACQRLAAVGIPVLGSIVIGVDQTSSMYGGLYGYGYGEGYGYGVRSANQEAGEARADKL